MLLRFARPASLALLLISGCATATQKRADASFAHGDYLTAAELYDAAVKEKPGRAQLERKRWQARQSALVQLGERARTRRSAKDLEAALAGAHALVEARQRWFGGADAARLDASVAAQADELASWAVRFVGEQVERALAAHEPLTAGQALRASHVLFRAGSFDARERELAERVQQAGASRCSELRQALPEGAAHLTFWVAEYCRAFGSEPPAVPAAPEQVGRTRVSVDTLAPTTPEQRARLEQRVAELVAASPWFHQAARASASLSIRGSLSVSFHERRAQRSATWIEQVPYQVRESYQEPYTDVEHYTDSEPYTTYRSESYSCGYGTSTSTCTRSVPSTQYRTVSKTRSVTKYRTQWRTVTRFQATPRVFSYEVTEHVGSYRAAWDITLGFGPGVDGLILPLRGESEASADEHQVTFVPANVKPARPVLMSHEQWFADRLALLSEHMPERLATHWVGSFCNSEQFEPEQAARCARGARASTPAQARTVLARFLRDDAELLLASH